MVHNEVKEKSLAFAKRIVNAYRYLCEEKNEYVLSKQFLRSGTSIGANVTEAQYASSKKDFLNKMYIALKECAETLYWMELLFETGYIPENVYKPLQNQCGQIRRMLISSLNTTKANQSNK